MQFPPNPTGPQQGLGYYPPASNQPASIQIIAIFAIVLGALTLLCDGLSSILTMVGMAVPHANAALRTHQSMPTQIFAVAQGVIGFALGGMELAGGIGGVQLRAWGRKLLVNWAILNLVFHAITFAVGLYFTLSATMPALQQRMNQQGRGLPPGMGKMVVASGVGFFITIAAVSCVFPICVLIFWRKPAVIQAFENPAQP